MQKTLKYVLIGVAGVFAILILLIAFSYFFPATFEARAKLPGTTSEVMVELKPTHPYLPKYKRALVLHNANAVDQRVEMFPDNGGYSRTQLYQLSNRRFRIEGFFDAYIVDAQSHTISPTSKIPSEKGKYLGAFYDTGDHQWRFRADSELPELELKESNRDRLIP
jgi:hypothetical protein